MELQSFQTPRQPFATPSAERAENWKHLRVQAAWGLEDVQGKMGV